MKAATIHEIKQELLLANPATLTELCLRLGKFKKENKELLTYLLFEAHDEQAYINSIRQEIDDEFAAINMSNLYFAKKSLRKIVRMISKYCRYSNQHETELLLRIHFCTTLKNSEIPLDKNPVISNLYLSQVKKINQLLNILHEDLQYDYRKQVEQL